MEIQSTTDYKRFKTIKGNRKLSIRHINNLVNSISNSNLTPLKPIVINKEWEIIDGQHRLAAAEKAKIPIYYVVADFANLEDVILLNANLKAWQMGDFLESYVIRNFEHYIYIKDYISRTGMSISLSLELLAHHTSSSEKLSQMRQSFKEGDFIITTKDFAEEIATNLLGIKQYTDGDIWKTRDFIRALLLAYKYVDQTYVLQKMKEQNTLITKKPNALGYVRVLEDLINFKRQAPIRLY